MDMGMVQGMRLVACNGIPYTLIKRSNDYHKKVNNTINVLWYASSQVKHHLTNNNCIIHKLINVLGNYLMFVKLCQQFVSICIHAIIMSNQHYHTCKTNIKYFTLACKYVSMLVFWLGMKEGSWDYSPTCYKLVHVCYNNNK